jgi:EmrB/QacA subfamily drug resistance transporter
MSAVTRADLDHPSTAPAAGQRRAGPRLLSLLVLLAATFVTSLDFFIVNVAIPAIQSDLRASAADIQWVVAGFGLALAGSLILAGRLGDMFGRRRVFALGLAAFTLASVACGLAPGAEALIVGRVAQGVAAALMGPQVLALLRTIYSGPAQARAFSMYGLTLGIGAVFGQLIGGLLIRADLFGFGWRSCFLINLPVGLVALALVARAIPESRAPRRPGLDPLGVTLVCAALVALVLPLIQGRAQGWPLWTWLCLAGAAALFTLFGAHQRQLGAVGGDPLVPAALFRDRAVTAGFLAQLVFWSGQGSFFLILALYLQQGRGLSALVSGGIVVVIGASYLVASSRAHRIQERLGNRTIPLGALIMAAGLGALWLATHEIGVGGGVWWLAPGLLIDGVGMGMAIVPLTSNVLTRISPALVGSASAVIATTQQVGGALGIALIGIVFYDHVELARPASYAHGFGLGLGFLVVLELLLVALTARTAPAAPHGEVVHSSPNAS